MNAALLSDARPTVIAEALLASVTRNDRAAIEVIAAHVPTFAPETRRLAQVVLAYLRDDLAQLITDALTDAEDARVAPYAYARLRRVPEKAPELFAAWLWLLQKDATHKGASAFRTLLGDVSEAAFRSLQLGANVSTLLGAQRSGLLVDLLTAELPSTTDFFAARGMTWLLGVLGKEGDALADSARSAIERARARFRDASFQRDCAAMLDGGPWPGLLR